MDFHVLKWTAFWLAQWRDARLLKEEIPTLSSGDKRLRAHLEFRLRRGCTSSLMVHPA
jgi:hypothetical protein